MGITPPETAGEIGEVCAAFGLPTAIDCTMNQYTAAIGRDKKSAGENISVILLEEIGRAKACPMGRDALLKQVAALTGG